MDHGPWAIDIMREGGLVDDEERRRVKGLINYYNLSECNIAFLFFNFVCFISLFTSIQQTIRYHNHKQFNFAQRIQIVHPFFIVER